jgi:hypothetical protein
MREKHGSDVATVSSRRIGSEYRRDVRDEIMVEEMMGALLRSACEDG